MVVFIKSRFARSIALVVRVVQPRLGVTGFGAPRHSEAATTLYRVAGRSLARATNNQSLITSSFPLRIMGADVASAGVLGLEYLWVLEKVAQLQ